MTAGFVVALLAGWPPDRPTTDRFDAYLREQAESNQPPPTLAFLGDSYVEGVGADDADQGFAYQVVERLGWAGVVDGVSGSGYITPGAGAPFEQRAADLARTDPDVIVVSGGFNDNGRGYPPADITEAAVRTFRALTREAPDADILVVGPLPVAEDVPEGELEVRDAIEAAAVRANVAFVDPLAEDWVDRIGWDTYIGPDGVHPSQRGHDMLADRVTAAVRELPAVATPASRRR